ncbi:MAG TPA: TIGR01212 family radical SAM protein [Arcobacter sp.]|jgi:radical SAM protein (TIGR01212 family)|nr:TIGR01212 family radical SAM protein [Arcobacter sp.]
MSYKQVLTIGKYFRDKFGEKVYKVPVSISGFTCPNIDGTVAKGGCTFCENESFSPNLTDKSRFKLKLDSKENPYLETQLQQLEMQFNATRERLENKFGAKKFLVYFQSFTNTYAPLDTLKTLYEKALTFEGVVGLSIGTRTDCITNETLDYLVELKNRKLPSYLQTLNSSQNNYEIWVEYGIQSIYDETLEKINRGHDWANIKEWIDKTKAKGLLVCGHVIFGLPDETQEMMLQTVTESINLNIDSIKFHPLYVTKNTLLTIDYKKGLFKPISEELYIDTLVKSIKMLPDNISISRVTAGIGDKSLLDPEWCSNKHNQMKNIKKALMAEKLFY